MEEASKSARREPSLSMTMPSRISCIGTNAWVACEEEVGILARGSSLIFYIELPGKVLEFSFRDARRTRQGCRDGLGSFCLREVGPRFPERELLGEKI